MGDKFRLAASPTYFAVLAAFTMTAMSGSADAFSKPKFQSFRVAGATQTVALGLNDWDVVAGGCADKKGIHGFVRTADGAVTKFDAPGAGRDGVTVAYAINNF